MYRSESFLASAYDCSKDGAFLSHLTQHLMTVLKNLRFSSCSGSVYTLDPSKKSTSTNSVPLRN